MLDIFLLNTTFSVKIKINVLIMFETQSLATSLLPKFASDIGYDVELLKLISNYQNDPGTQTYQTVQKYLVKVRDQDQKILDSFNNNKTFTRIDMNILDYEDNLLWSTAPLNKQDRIILLYQASEYSSQATQGSSYQKFEDGSEFTLAWVSGGPLFSKGGALKFGSNSSTPDCYGTLLQACSNATYQCLGGYVSTNQSSTGYAQCVNCEIGNFCTKKMYWYF